MTPPPAPGTADATRPPLPLLLIPYVVLVIVAAATPTADLFPDQGDINLYLEKAAALASGQVPYRDFPFEYPPLALVPMAVPYLLWPFGAVDLGVYKWLFVGWEAALMIALGLVLARLVRLGAFTPAAGPGFEAPVQDQLRQMAIRVAILTVGAALAIAWRFDLFPALLLMIALWAALDGRPGMAGVAVGLGVLAKLYPLAVVPALAVPWLLRLDRDRLVRFGMAAAVTIVVGLVPFVLVAGVDVFAFLAYQALRGLQIESVAGGLVVLVGLASGQPVEQSFGFSAVQVTGPLASTWLALLPVVTAVGFGLLAWVGWRRIRAESAASGGVAPRTVVMLAAASVLILLVTSKVFSIQYVVWIVPFAALLPSRQFWLAAVLVGLTMPIHPVLYEGLVDQDALPILVLNLRNALLVVLTVWVIADLRPGRVGRGTGSGAMEARPA